MEIVKSENLVITDGVSASSQEAEHANGTLQSNGETAVTISMEMPEEYLDLDLDSFKTQMSRDTAALRAKGWKIEIVRGPEE